MDSIEELPKRIIKFRAWDKVAKTWFRNGDGFSIDWDASHITDDNDERTRTAPTIVLMQFTGLLDKNGKEIYEGDWLSVSPGYSSTVEFKDGCFVSVYKHPEDGEIIPLSEVIGKDTEIVGNIYQS